MKRIPTLGALTLSGITLLATTALAKLPPLSDEAKAKAAETAAKTAHGNKLAEFQLCKSMDRVAGAYRDGAKKAGKAASAATETPACADPGPFVYTPPAPASGPVAAAPAAPAAVAATTAAATTAAAPAKK
ncbi:hypothetical protein [Aquabacterium sp. OR-4]|uniref:hypothetical protein n=1 Tax=Aquabacterium sp. OR-4 TaxID=2978127 RepID=UPI0021B292EF|nr:hypothetical protein [Aquabacterium sp. OR-4]MDT7838687.1 hypothetical protein [Aquabacterium sp. OR-4]